MPSPFFPEICIGCIHDRPIILVVLHRVDLSHNLRNNLVIRLAFLWPNRLPYLLFQDYIHFFVVGFLMEYWFFIRLLEKLFSKADRTFTCSLYPWRRVCIKLKMLRFYIGKSFEIAPHVWLPLWFSQVVIQKLWCSFIYFFAQAHISLMFGATAQSTLQTDFWILFLVLSFMFDDGVFFEFLIVLFNAKRPVIIIKNIQKTIFHSH